MDLRQAYNILEIPENSSIQEIKDAHSVLLQIWHPDLHQQRNKKVQSKANEKMQEINAARDCIIDYMDSIKPGGGSTGTGSKHDDSNETIIVCPECGTKNRFRLSVDREGAKCGRCAGYLFRKTYLCSDESCIGVIGSDGRCRVCGLPYTKVSEDPPPPPPPTLTYKNPFVAVILSFIWAGLGQIYIGEYYKGRRIAFMYCISVLLLFFAVGFVTTPVLWFFGMYDAYTSAIRNNKRLGV
jgi:TM2 domain-containing membrane protein YozV